jgi:hypothetical protein
MPAQSVDCVSSLRLHDEVTAMSYLVRFAASFVWLVPGLGLYSPTLHARDKVDVITVNTGDRITGEIVKLEYGYLTVSTDYMSKVQIEWPDVVAVQSKQGFVIEDLLGDVYYGSLSTDGSGTVTIAPPGGEGARQLPVRQFARVSPSETAFIQRLNGSFSVGYDYAKSTDISTFNGNFNTTYRGDSVVWNFGFEFNSTKDPVQGTLDRDNLSFNYRWLREHGTFWTGLSSLERNEATGIEARLALGGGLGKYLRQTSQSEIAALVGVGAIREWATGEEDSQDSLEGILGVEWRIFDFATPKATLTAQGVVYPSITESGRYRTDVSVSLRRELIPDFYLDLSFYHTYDQQPPDPTAEKSDYGVTTSLGYSF